MRATRGVLIRDFMIYGLKLVLDGFKDLFLLWASVFAVVLDLFRGGKKKRFFYTVMKLGERVDLWLNLHGTMSKEDDDEGADGLFGASKAGSDNLLGQIEQAVRGGDVPRTVRKARDPLDDLDL